MYKPRITEKNYIERLRKKDEAALEYVIERYGGLLYSILRKKLTLLPDKVDECFDDVLLKAWEHINDYDETRCEFKGWLAAIARYQAIDYLRKARREEMVHSLDDMPIEPGAEDDRFRLLEETTSDETEKILACRSPEDREIFRRLYLEEDSIEIISRDMNLSKEQIYNHTSRGKKKIRNFYPFRKEKIYGQII